MVWSGAAEAVDGIGGAATVQHRVNPSRQELSRMMHADAGGGDRLALAVLAQ